MPRDESAQLRQLAGTGVGGDRVNMTQLCAMFGTTDKTVKTWIRSGMGHHKAVIGKRTQYEFDTATVFKWRLQHERDRLSGSTKENRMTLDQARLRKEAANALTAELELAKSRELVAPMDYQVEQFSHALQKIRAGLISLPNRISGVIEYRPAKEIRVELEREVNEILTEIVSDYNLGDDEIE